MNLSEWKNIYFDELKNQLTTTQLIELQLSIIKWNWDVVLYFLKLYSKEFNYINSDLQKMIKVYTINVITKKNILWYYFYEYYQWLPFELEILKILKANQDLKYLGNPYKKNFNNVVNKI